MLRLYYDVNEHHAVTAFQSASWRRSMLHLYHRLIYCRATLLSCPSYGRPKWAADRGEEQVSRARLHDEHSDYPDGRRMPAGCCYADSPLRQAPCAGGLGRWESSWHH